MPKSIPLFLISLFISQAYASQEQFFAGFTMGTTYSVKINGKSMITQQEVDARLRQLSMIFSTWEEESELSHLNRLAVGKWLHVSDELLEVLQTSHTLYLESDGYFNPSLGKIIELWGFDATTQIEVPKSTELSSALANASLANLAIQDGRVMKKAPLKINLSAIAKGFAVDQIVSLMEQKGMQNFLVEIGGEAKTRGRANLRDWRVGIEDPSGGFPIEIPLHNLAVATSGNYHNFRHINNQKYGHILAPNGEPTWGELASVTVLAESAMIADAWATAFFAMGHLLASNYAQSLGLPVLFIIQEPQGYIRKSYNWPEV